MSLQSAELFDQLSTQLASDVADKVRMDIDLGTFVAESLDYSALAEKTIAEMDMDSVASDVMDKLDYTDIASNLDMADLAREVIDELDLEDIADNLDVEKIARTIRYQHAEEIAEEVAGHLIRSDVLLEKMAEIAEDRISAAADPLDPETRLTVIATNVADRLKQSDDMRDMFAEVASQLISREKIDTEDIVNDVIDVIGAKLDFTEIVGPLVRKEVRRVLIQLVIGLSGPAVKGEPVDLGEIRFERVTPT